MNLATASDSINDVLAGNILLTY